MPGPSLTLTPAEVWAILHRWHECRQSGGGCSMRDTPSSSSAEDVLELVGTVGQRVEECRRRYEPTKRVSVLEVVLKLEGTMARTGDPSDRTIARLKRSPAYESSMEWLARSLAVAAEEDWRLMRWLYSWYRGG